MAELRLERLGVDVRGRRLLAGVDIVIDDGAFVAIVGPSGSGKSTLLRAVAGLVDLSYGRLLFDGLDVTARSPGERDVGMVFQTPALLPRRSVRRNVAFPLEIRHQTAADIRMRVNAETRAMHIEHLLTRRPDQLSRGEEQLVQIARAMVRTPRVLLLDEPFAPLDEHLRRRMRAEIGTLQAGYGVTTLMATNDPDDVDALASAVVVLGSAGPEGSGGAGHVVQAGPTTSVAERPVTIDVAYALGAVWTVAMRVEADGHGFWLVTEDEATRIRAWRPELDAYRDRDVTVGFRSGDLHSDPTGDVSAVLDRVVPGTAASLMCSVAGSQVFAHGDPDIEIGSTLRLRASSWFVFDDDTGTTIC